MTPQRASHGKLEVLYHKLTYIILMEWKTTYTKVSAGRSCVLFIPNNVTWFSSGKFRHQIIDKHSFGIGKNSDTPRIALSHLWSPAGVSGLPDT